MALARRGVNRFSANIWPGFVDAMTALLLVLTFVLSIFMVVQFVLREKIDGQDKELDNLSTQIQGLAEALGFEQQRAENLTDDLSTTRLTLQATESSLLSTEDKLKLAEEQVAEQFAVIQGLVAENNRRAEQITSLEAENARELSEKEAAQLALATAREEIDVAAEEARLAAAKREALEAMIADLETDNAGKAEALTQLEQDRLAEAAAAAALRERLANSQDEMTALTLALEEKRKEAEDTLTLLAAVELAKAELSDTLAALEIEKADTTTQNLALSEDKASLEASVAQLLARVADLEGERDTLADTAAAELSRKEQQAVLLAQANKLLADEQAVSAESQRQIALLNAQTLELRQQLDQLQGLLDEAEAQDIASKIQLEALGKNLNVALARVASEQKKTAEEQRKLAEAERARAELEEAERKRLEEEANDLRKYRSEFMAQLRQVLEGQEGVRIVGDRFVFSSEVLFAQGSDILGPEGRAEIRKVAGIINDIADQIPPEINWLLRVDGHTDKIPLSGGGLIRDNWELSQARALSVVRYLSGTLGIPPDRLSANGFGEFQPIDPSDTPAAYALNRRIELKFTEK